jgi:hypothetical protein
MITKRTVFVLGAGASEPFGFPTGAELYQKVVDGLREGPDVDFFRNDAGYSSSDIRTFRDALFLSGKNSVDAFLEHRLEFVEIGKAAMSRVLVLREAENGLFRPQHNWLRYAYDRLSASFEEFGNNAISFVTFNYDRSVEHFLFTALRNSYGRSEAECKELMGKIPIIHLHGRLGFLPWERDGGRPYDQTIDLKVLKYCVQNIKIVSEDITDRDNEFVEARKLLEKAERIYFLGFGYAPTNMQRLGVENLGGSGKLIVGSGYKLTRKEVASIISAGKGAFTTDIDVTLDCLGFLRNIIEWS